MQNFIKSYSTAIKWAKFVKLSVKVRNWHRKGKNGKNGKEYNV